MRRVLLFLLMAALSVTVASAQEKQNTDKGGTQFSIKIEPFYGSYTNHSYHFDKFRPFAPKGINFGFELPSSQQRPWQQYMGNPTWGIGLSYIDFGHPMVGKAVSMYPYLLIPAVRSNHFNLQFKVAGGLGLVTEHWYTCNVGADSPEELGGHYAWGEIEVKTYYEDPSYKWLDFSTGDIIKYNDDDGKTILDSEDDAAQVLLGSGWRMPTNAEIQELMDKCTWVWTSVNGVKGYKVSGNGNSIFLPAAGSRYEDITTNQGTRGCYMSSTLYVDDNVFECCLAFNKKDHYWINEYRRNGHTIRPVKK